MEKDNIKTHRLGKSDVIVPAIGVGTMLWLPGKKITETQLFETYKTCLDLYLLHTPPKYGSIREYMDVMAEAVKMGKVRAVGVCNCSKDQIKEAYTALDKHNIPLAVAMVGYNILRRYPEINGVFDVCKKLGISIIPYAPLAEGALTGRYRKKFLLNILSLHILDI